MDHKLVGIVLLALLLGFIVNHALYPREGVEEDTLERIVSEGKIKVCYFNYAPLSMKNPNSGEISGESIEAIEYIANEAGFDVEYVESSWGTFIAALQSGQCDVAGTPLFTRTERAKSVAFTRPMFYIHNSVLIRKNDARFQDLEDFNNANVTIAVLQGEVGHLYAQKHLAKANVVVLPGGDISLVLAQVSSGNADAAFTDGWTIEKYAGNHPETEDFLNVNPDAIYGINPTAWAVRHGDTALLNFLDTCIYNMEADGKLIEWGEKYGSNWLRQDFELVKRT